MAGLSALAKLRKLDLGANRIRVLDEAELCNLTSLEELWIGKNKIESIAPDCFKTLKKLRRLDLQSNRLTKLEHLHHISDTLEELYLSHNAITNEGLALGFPKGLEFPNLSTLDVSRNLLTSSDSIAHLTSIDDLWLSGNKICDFECIKSLENLISLDCIYLEYNPIADDFEYRIKVKQIIGSNLNQIDATPISTNELLHLNRGRNPHVKGVLKPSSVVFNVEEMEKLQGQVIDLAKAQQSG